MAKMVLGVFSDDTMAADAIRELDRVGFDPKDISIIMKNQQPHVEPGGSNIGEGLLSGAATGGVIGALTGLAVGIGAFTIPGIGAFLIGGPLAVALGLSGAAATTVTGAVTGAVAGGILGALVGLGIPEEDALVYEERIREGGILVAVPAVEGEEMVASDILTEYDADQIKVITTAEKLRGRSKEYDRPAFYSELRTKRRKS